MFAAREADFGLGENPHARVVFPPGGRTMGKPIARIDAETFARTASLFAAKRSTLSQDAVGTLAADIMRRLALAAAHPPGGASTPACAKGLAEFCDALVEREPDAALRFIEARRAEGATREDVYFGYIAAAARQFGESWRSNRLTFAQIAIGTGHLYALLRALRVEGDPDRSAYDSRKTALFATVPGEEHGLGITIAADFFRDDGWEIDLQTGMDHDSLVARIERTRPQIIGLSLSTEQRLKDLVRLVVEIRIIVPDAIVGATPTALLDEKKLRRLVDLDLVFRDARAACAELDRLIRLRG